MRIQYSLITSIFILCTSQNWKSKELMKTWQHCSFYTLVARRCSILCGPFSVRDWSRILNHVIISEPLSLFIIRRWLSVRDQSRVGSANTGAFSSPLLSSTRGDTVVVYHTTTTVLSNLYRCGILCCSLQRFWSAFAFDDTIDINHPKY